MPTIKYNVRGTVAGKADYGSWTVMFNPVLLMENVDKFIARTVPHELAHLGTDLVYPEAHRPGLNGLAGFPSIYGGRKLRRKKREIHGPRWREVMWVLGVKDISRCHNYDVSNAQVKRKSSRNSFIYVCTGCNSELSMGPKRHAKMLIDPRALSHAGCRRALLVLKGSAAPVAKAPVAKPKQKKAAKGSKLEQAMRLYENWHAKYNRKEMINVFVQELGMTQAGASTYYYNCQKMYNA